MLVPTVGSRIKVTIADTHGARMIPPRTDAIVYEGTVVNPDKWLNDRQFCMSGTARYPIRVLDMSRISKIEVITGKLREIDTSVKTWTVDGSKGNKYTVTRTNGKWACTCTGYQFRKQCKHITELSNKNV